MMIIKTALLGSLAKLTDPGWSRHVSLVHVGCAAAGALVLKRMQG